MGVKSRVERYVKKLLQSQGENTAGLKHRSSNEIKEKRMNWTDK